MIKFDFSLFSKYRLELMGIATVEVLANHFMQWTHVYSSTSILDFLVLSIVFPANVLCFLLLSGLGLYYSFSRNSDVKLFYKRRIQRVWLPFMIIAAPLYLVIAYHEKASVLDYIGWVTSFGYWFGDTRFWFIALSLVLYAFFPFCYKWMMSCSSDILKKTVVLSFVAILVSFSISYLFPVYFDKIQFSIPKVPMFFIGIYYGYLVQKQAQINLFKCILVFLCMGGVFFCISRIEGFFFNYVNISLQLITLTLLCLFIEKCNGWKMMNVFIKIWRWVGKYSLELYILHLLIGIIAQQYVDLSLIGNSLIVLLLAFVFCKPSQMLAKKVTEKIM